MADSKTTPVAKDLDATVDELHARADADYRKQQALEAARGKKGA